MRQMAPDKMSNITIKPLKRNRRCKSGEITAVSDGHASAPLRGTSGVCCSFNDLIHADGRIGTAVGLPLGEFLVLVVAAAEQRRLAC